MKPHFAQLAQPRNDDSDERLLDHRDTAGPDDGGGYQAPYRAGRRPDR